MIPHQVEDVAGGLCGPVSSFPVTPPSQSSLKGDAMPPPPRKVTADAVGLSWGPTGDERGQFGAAGEQVRQCVVACRVVPLLPLHLQCLFGRVSSSHLCLLISQT